MAKVLGAIVSCLPLLVAKEAPNGWVEVSAPILLLSRAKKARRRIKGLDGGYGWATSARTMAGAAIRA